jgi:hypothetical protein
MSNAHKQTLELRTVADLFILGIIPVTTSELNVFEKYGKVNIKDNSFSAYIRDCLDTQTLLLIDKSIGCLKIYYKKIIYFQ